MPGLAWRFLGKKACLCTTAKRDSFYDDLPNKSFDEQSIDSLRFTRSEKPRRLIRQTNMDESDGDDDASITEKLRRASSKSPANIPMLVVVSFNPDGKGLQKNQIEIQRGFPVNAQFIVNEWLFVKTADNEEGFVPYVCCRPMLRRQSLKPSTIDIEHSYKPYDFDSRQFRASKSPSTSVPTVTPPSQKKLLLSTTSTSQSCLLQNNVHSSKKRQDVTSSSCGGDSGFSDCESSHHHHRSFDFSTQRSARSSNIRSLRLASKKQGLIVEDTPSKKSIRTNQNLSKSNVTHRVKSQLSISSNSAFTQFVKKTNDYEVELESNQDQSSQLKTRLFYHRQDVSPSSSSISHLRRPYNSYDETCKYSSPSSKCPSTISSPYIRRTPFSRRSLPHHLQPVLKKALKPVLSSSPDPFRTINKEQHLRHVVLAEPSIPPSKSTLERQFSDLSLNQIENDSLMPSIINEHRPSLSCSSSSSASSSSSDESTTAFVHIQMKNSTCHISHRGQSIPIVFSGNKINTNSNATATNSTSFIHNVSITV